MNGFPITQTLPDFLTQYPSQSYFLWYFLIYETSNFKKLMLLKISPDSAKFYEDIYNHGEFRLLSFF